VSKGLLLRCRGGGEDQADIGGVEDVGDAERRGVEDADGTAAADDVGGIAGVNDAGRDSSCFPPAASTEFHAALRVGAAICVVTD